MASRAKARELRRRRHRDQERWARHHPAGTAVAVPVPGLAGRGSLVTTAITITNAAAAVSSGAGCLCALAHDVVKDASPDYALPSYQRLVAAKRPAGLPPSLMESGAPRASRERPWATIWWADITGSGYRAFATFWPTEEIARQHKCVDPTAIVVNVAKSKKEYETVDGALRTGRGVIANPYPAERKNLDPLSMSANYDGWSRASARPLTSSFHS
jgi:hypothetical protein